MTDIVERLRAIATNAPGWPERGFLMEAADEIERLQEALKSIINECENMAEARTQARRALEHKP